MGQSLWPGSGLDKKVYFLRTGNGNDWKSKRKERNKINKRKARAHRIIEPTLLLTSRRSPHFMRVHSKWRFSMRPGVYSYIEIYISKRKVKVNFKRLRLLRAVSNAYIYASWCLIREILSLDEKQMLKFVLLRATWYVKEVTSVRVGLSQQQFEWDFGVKLRVCRRWEIGEIWERPVIELCTKATWYFVRFSPCW